jgi:NAD(P)-dependent dehydrogenase (short-subunit alcohol dehydrogenase family)
VQLPGQVCVVTGAGRGIGRHTAEVFAREGACLAVCSRSAGELEDLRRDLGDTYGTEVLALPVDVADAGAVIRFAGAVVERFGHVDVLVNNAGVYGPVGIITEVDMDDWVGAISVNVFGVVHAIRAFVPAMRTAGGGRIINLAGGGIGGPGTPSRVSAYTASKAAVAGLTETLAKELAPEGIWINAIAPGAINTSLIDTVIRAGPEAAGAGFHAASVHQREGGDPIGKVGEAMLFLASGRSSCLTGKLLSAKWDPLGSLAGQVGDVNARSLYTLRRIDGEFFVEAQFLAEAPRESP